MPKKLEKSFVHPLAPERPIWYITHPLRPKGPRPKRLRDARSLIGLTVLKERDPGFPPPKREPSEGTRNTQIVNMNCLL